MQRLILRLPSEARNGSVVAVAVEIAANAKIIVEIGCSILQQSRVVKVLDQPRAEGWRGDAEDDVIGPLRGVEVRLLQPACAGVGAARHDEDGFHASVRGVGARKEWEPGFPGWTIGRNEI